MSINSTLVEPLEECSGNSVDFSGLFATIFPSTLKGKIVVTYSVPGDETRAQFV